MQQGHNVEVGQAGMRAGRRAGRREGGRVGEQAVCAGDQRSSSQGKTPTSPAATPPTPGETAPAPVVVVGAVAPTPAAPPGPSSRRMEIQTSPASLTPERLARGKRVSRRPSSKTWGKGVGEGWGRGRGKWHEERGRGVRGKAMKCSKSG